MGRYRVPHYVQSKNVQQWTNEFLVHADDGG